MDSGRATALNQLVRASAWRTDGCLVSQLLRWVTDKGRGCALFTHRDMPSPVRGDMTDRIGQQEDGAADSYCWEGRLSERAVCALEMEITNRSPSSKVTCANCDGAIHLNCSDSTEVSMSLTGRRATHMEGHNLYRLRDRKLLIEDKKRLCALALGAALLGILLMIIHAEICPHVYKPVSSLQETDQNDELSNKSDSSNVTEKEKVFFKVEARFLSLFIATFAY